MRSRAIQLGIEGCDILHEVLQLSHLAFDDISSVIHDWKSEVIGKSMGLMGGYLEEVEEGEAAKKLGWKGRDLRIRWCK